jgi:glutamate dehydrogenase (NAD(P)+)
LLRRQGRSPEGLRVAVQGFGNVGQYAANIMASEYGSKIVAVSDVSGAIYNPNGLDIPTLIEDVRRHPSRLLQGYGMKGEVDHITNAELLELDMDVLIPAALQDQITVANADKVRASVIVEGANGPTTFEADQILNDRGIQVVPDILANAGGVIVSYFEWVQDLQSFFWSIENVRKELHQVMGSAFEEVWSLAEKERTSLRTAAYLASVDRVVSAFQLRGLFP